MWAFPKKSEGNFSRGFTRMGADGKGSIQEQNGSDCRFQTLNGNLGFIELDGNKSLIRAEISACIYPRSSALIRGNIVFPRDSHQQRILPSRP